MYVINKYMMVKKVGFVFIVMFVFLINSASAQFAVTTTYSDGYPLVLEAGEDIGVFFKVRNLGSKDISMEVVPDESEIAEFIQSTLKQEIKVGEEVRVPVMISIPEGVEYDKRYEVGALFRDVSDLGDEGQVQFAFSIKHKFPVIVGSLQIGPEIVEEEFDEGKLEKMEDKGEKIYGNLVFSLIIAVLIVSIILILFLIRKKRRIQEIKEG